jgi:hypothetical protein
MKPLARREYVEVYRYRGRRYGIQGSEGYTVDTWTVGGWRECRGGTLSSGDQHVYSRPGNDKCSENAGSLRELYARSKCGNSLLPSVFAQKIIVFIENGLQSSEVQCLSVGHDLPHPVKLKSRRLHLPATTTFTILLHPKTNWVAREQSEHQNMQPVCSKAEIHGMARLGMHCDITRVLAHKRSSAASVITPRPLRTNHAATSRGGVAFDPVEPWWCELSVRTT